MLAIDATVDEIEMESGVDTTPAETNGGTAPPQTIAPDNINMNTDEMKPPGDE